MSYSNQFNYPHAASHHPNYSGFFGYITPYNDGSNMKILRTDGTLHIATEQSQNPSSRGCNYGAGPYRIQNWQQPPGNIRCCPSNENYRF